MTTPHRQDDALRSALTEARKVLGSLDHPMYAGKTGLDFVRGGRAIREIIHSALATPASRDGAEGTGLADKIKAADAMPPEATFNNGAAMLGWLNDDATPPKPALDALRDAVALIKEAKDFLVLAFKSRAAYKSKINSAMWRLTYAERALSPAPVPPADGVLREAKERTVARDNLREAWSAMAMIRETIETLGPVGALQASEHLAGPTFTHEAEALVAGIQKIAAASGATQDDIEEAAVLLWHRFANPSVTRWEDETHKAEYRLAAKDIFALTPLPAVAAEAVALPKRPFTFAVQRAPENGKDKWRLFLDEQEARDAAEQLDGDYEALYRVGDRRSTIQAFRAASPHQVMPDLGPDWLPPNPAIEAMFASPPIRGEREGLIEQCAKIAEPWPGFWLDENSTDADRAVVAVRTEIAKNIRALVND